MSGLIDDELGCVEGGFGGVLRWMREWVVGKEEGGFFGKKGREDEVCGMGVGDGLMAVWFEV